MRSRRVLVVVGCVALFAARGFLLTSFAKAQPATTLVMRDELHPVAEFAMRMDGPVMRRQVATGEPFTVAGPQGVLVGQQQGLLEAWVVAGKAVSRPQPEAGASGF